MERQVRRGTSAERNSEKETDRLRFRERREMVEGSWEWNILGNGRRKRRRGRKGSDMLNNKSSANDWSLVLMEIQDTQPHHK